MYTDMNRILKTLTNIDKHNVWNISFSMLFLHSTLLSHWNVTGSFTTRQAYKSVLMGPSSKDGTYSKEVYFK